MFSFYDIVFIGNRFSVVKDTGFTISSYLEITDSKIDSKRFPFY